MGKRNGTERDVCSDERTGRTLVPVDVALSKALFLANAIDGTESVALQDGTGRVLANDITAPFPLPPFDNSGMDGYAFRAGDLIGDGPWTLAVAARIIAGDNAALVGTLGPAQAARIFTGAGIPAGADTVIMQERVTRQGDLITISGPIRKGNNIRLAGEDAQSGTVLVSAGTELGTREIAAIASVGLPIIEVRRKLKVALFCTGNELRQPGERLEPGQIFNSNLFMMKAALSKPWISLLDLGAVRDDPQALRDTLTRAASQCDLIVTTGGVSVGEEDHMVAQLLAAGGEIDVMKIAMKPGKPLSIGRLNGAIFLGLPGNPVAAFTTWNVIGLKVAGKMAGIVARNPLPYQVELAKGIVRRPGRQEYRPARLCGMSDDGYPQVELLDRSFSAKVSLICKADGFAIIPADVKELAPGDRLGFLPL